MKIFNRQMTKELRFEDLDFTKGRLVNSKLKTTNADGQVTVENVFVYIPHAVSETFLAIKNLKRQLEHTDYQAIKVLERIIDILVASGLLSAEEYAEIKAKRQAWRDRINELEALIKATED